MGARQVAPDLRDALHINPCLRAFRQHSLADLWEVRLDVHGEVTAKRAEACMYLGADATCPRSGSGMDWPEMPVGELFCEVLDDGERIPDSQTVIDQDE